MRETVGRYPRPADAAEQPAIRPVAVPCRKLAPLIEPDDATCPCDRIPGDGSAMPEHIVIILP
ncbi:hypothetical protein CN97_00160 [Haematobacter massiliensis]|uniref:Uncharacterized protein n=1 Tax=Haematobacter massiliensis TaxID=195105 RepID=A0A086Y0G5_9RHOB|nr:hypothetical protein CN97_00160 [Haematobacter massiliensis]OWJ80974.1 hypothetical protein CDV51_19840 [Haematobacter massiliensis]